MSKYVLAVIAGITLASCNGSFRAGYVVDLDWDNYTEADTMTYPEDSFTCVDVHGDGTYTVNNQGCVS